MKLPKTAIEKDHKLETSVTSASEKLAEHRWHWTLDESNDKRVSLSEYARAVGRNRALIHRYAHGWALFTGVDTRVDTIGEAIQRASVGAETEAATEAVAKGHGIAFSTARQTKSEEIRSVRQLARDRAERQGSTVEEEVGVIAERQRIGRESRQAQRERDRARHGAAFDRLDSLLIRARQNLRHAVQAAVEGEGEFDDEERELAAWSIGQVRAMLGLVESAVTGTADVDWDAELATLNEQGE